mgnify:CR=1 FL=1
MPHTLLGTVRPKPSGVFFDEGRFLGIIGVSPHDVVGETFDFLARDEARANFHVPYHPPNTADDRQQTGGDDKPLEGGDEAIPHEDDEMALLKTP